ncbi:ATP-dependent helicase HrpB [Stenotrophomonas maltophilia]|uniref:ATP-dependent helicase HrpB n=1 Tax=Stenotrophomonas maltophilia TaxID=40324 RepID=UPI0019D4AC69|nr:ATP-dependent helicase HrpB [Stenotrophomonas maltophilia]MBN7918114.1 ATP-dependent helicase HrpB [Stenotrophomonas maltophilia]
MNASLFPISPLLPQIQQHLAAQQRLVLEAPPGAGKTTQVPLALLDAPWLQGRKIILLEPRRVAARSAALFMARQLGEEVGGTVGYRIRFENKVSARTRIEVVTEGILTRMLQDDPMLEEVGAILFDEFHERHLSGDLGLALALDVQAQLRDDLRLVVMSATLDGERLARFLDAPRLSSEGRSYPVAISHFPARRDEALELQVRRAVQQALAEHPGDLLVFLPGQREIARVQAGLQESLNGDVEVLALHGELPVEQQARVLQVASDGRRRVVLATNVAESSVTLPGVRVVIDSGQAREPRYDPNSGFTRLDVVAIAQASADQRAGRAGRVAEGVAWRLWPQSQRLEPQRRALAARWRALAAFRNGRTPGDANRSGLAAIDAAAKQWRRRLRCEATPPASIEAHELGDLLAHAFPDRIGFQHPSDPLRYLLANGRSARLHELSDLRGEPWLVASELRFEARDALLLRAAPVDEDRLRKAWPDRFVTEDVVRWDSERRALVALRETRFDRIVLDSRSAGRVDPQHAAQALTDAVAELGLQALPWTGGLRQWQARVESLRRWMPELDLPDCSDAALLANLTQWLQPAFAGKSRLDALDEASFGEALKSPLEWSQRQLVERNAPTRITVPSGLERPITYALDSESGDPLPPVLAVKLQELFGLADTPRIADGRVPLTLHLLSPGGRPLQVTQDLRNFWENTYAEVKKEMKGRYPRHPWPDDPWTATATHRAKPRGT